MLLHTEAFAHRSFCTEKLLAFTHRSFEKLLHRVREYFTQSSFCTHRDIRAHFDCPGSGKMWVTGLSRSWAPAFFLQILGRHGSCEMSMCISTADCADSHKMCVAQILMRRSSKDPSKLLSTSSLHDPVQVLHRKFVEMLVRSSLKGPCVKILQMPW